MIGLWCEGNRSGGSEELPVPNGKEYGPVRLSCSLIVRKGVSMEINVSEEVQTQLDQVKEWMESKIGREVTYNDVILQVLKNFQNVLYPEDLGSA
jgi:hypothetical protein